jgi:hypothetical protein
MSHAHATLESKIIDIKRSLWIQILLATMASNLIGAVIRLSDAKDIGTYIVCFGVTVSLIVIGGLVVKILQIR